jgi:hypothetical protein
VFAAPKSDHAHYCNKHGDVVEPRALNKRFTSRPDEKVAFSEWRSLDVDYLKGI